MFAIASAVTFTHRHTYTFAKYALFTAVSASHRGIIGITGDTHCIDCVAACGSRVSRGTISDADERRSFTRKPSTRRLPAVSLPDSLSHEPVKDRHPGGYCMQEPPGDYSTVPGAPPTIGETDMVSRSASHRHRFHTVSDEPITPR